jgi:hypothetical protein
VSSVCDKEDVKSKKTISTSGDSPRPDALFTSSKPGPEVVLKLPHQEQGAAATVNDGRNEMGINRATRTFDVVSVRTFSGSGQIATEPQVSQTGYEPVVDSCQVLPPQFSAECLSPVALDQGSNTSVLRRVMPGAPEQVQFHSQLNSRGWGAFGYVRAHQSSKDCIRVFSLFCYRKLAVPTFMRGAVSPSQTNRCRRNAVNLSRRPQIRRLESERNPPRTPLPSTSEQPSAPLEYASSSGSEPTVDDAEMLEGVQFPSACAGPYGYSADFFQR